VFGVFGMFGIFRIFRMSGMFGMSGDVKSLLSFIFLALQKKNRRPWLK
jgi:hypothetical protein